MSLSLEGIGAVLQGEDEYTKIVRLVPWLNRCWMQAGQHLEPYSNTSAKTQGYGLKRSMKDIPPKLARVVAHAATVRKVEQDLE